MTLIDSGAVGSFIDESWALEQGIPLIDLKDPTTVFALDGNVLSKVRRTTIPEEPGDLSGVTEEYHYLAPLHDSDSHSQCAPSLGLAHATAALNQGSCLHCDSLPIAILRSRLALLSEGDPAPRALPLPTLEPQWKKRRAQRIPEKREKGDSTPAHSPCLSPSPHETPSPVLFSWMTARPVMHTDPSFPGRAEAWQAIPGISDWVINTVKRGYSLQFARRPPRFAQ
ncbi:hypothetical protein PO909_020724 [Leuciscus waleckii]